MAAEVIKEYMTWVDFESDIVDFKQYLASENINKDESIILGLKRGGLPAAVTLSNRMDIPISLVAFQTRDGGDVVPKFLEEDLIKNAKTIIIPDDIYDSGLTVETVVKILVEQYNKSLDNIIGLFHYGSEKMTETSLTKYKTIRPSNGNWIVFSWE